MNFLRTALALALAPLATGCTARVQTAHAVVDDDVVVDSAPVDVYTYPHTEYEGRTVYLVNGRWYYPRGEHWVYYRREPAPLVRHRHYVEQAPPAPRYRASPGEAVRVQ